MPAVWLIEERVERVERPDLELGDEVRDRLALGVQVEQDADVAELERAVHDDDLPAELGGGGDRQVDRDGRPADAALRAEDRDDVARARCRPSPARRPTGAAPGGDRHGRHPALLVALAGADLSDRCGQLVAAERLDQEFACAGEHRSAEVVRLALDGHHHDGGGRDGRRQLLGRGDAVHVRHVDVHEDDIRTQPDGHLERFAPGRGRADHVDVTFEAEELRQVIAGLGDVVDDEDADLVGHLALVGP